MTMLEFGRLINRLTVWGMRELEMHEIGELQKMITPVVQPVSTAPVPQRVTEYQLDTFMGLMHEGDKKIEAIKSCRELTGIGLKEAKDLVEKYWKSQPNLA